MEYTDGQDRQRALRDMLNAHLVPKGDAKKEEVMKSEVNVDAAELEAAQQRSQSQVASALAKFRQQQAAQQQGES